MGSKWERVTLGTYCSKIGSGATPRGGANVYLAKGDCALIRSQNIYNDGFKENGLVYLSENDALKLKNVIVYENDILINITGDSVARVCLAPIAFLPARVNQHVAIIRVNPEKLDAKFVRYYLITFNAQNHLLTLASAGATRNALTKEMLETFEIPLPPLEEQKRIAAILSAFDDKIALNQEMNKTLEAMAQALFKSWFVDFEPFGGVMPKDWREGTLGDYVTIKRGGSPRPIQEYLTDKGLRWLKISDVTSLSTPFVFEIKERIKEEGLKKTVFLNAGSLVLSNSATPGIPKFVAVDTCIHDGWLYFPKSKFSNEFLYLFFKEIRKNLVMLGNGSVFTNLKTDILKNYSIQTPTDEKLAKFDSIVNSLFERMKQNTFETLKLSQIRDILLSKLINGEINV